MIVLSIHCGHNSSAALSRDGRIVGAVQEERFTRRKNQAAFPVRSIQHLLDAHLSGDIGKVDRVAFTSTDVDPIGLIVSRYSDFSVQDHIAENKEYWHSIYYEGAPHDGAYWRQMYREGKLRNQDHNVDPEEILSRDLPDAARWVADHGREQIMRQHFKWTGAVDYVDHHTCHAYYAFWGSKLPAELWQRTLVLTADALGDGRNWSAWVSDTEGNLTEVGSGNDHRVARIYRFVTLILGMKPNEHEYKVMGLSGYRRTDKYTDAVEQILFEALDFVNGTFVSRAPLKDSYFDLRDRLEGHRFDNIAFAVQSWSTKVTAKWMLHWMERSGRDVVCFSGGLSMNIKMNGDLLNLPELHALCVPSSGGDESNPIGSCFFVSKRNDVQPKQLGAPYLGRMDGFEEDWRLGLLQAGTSEDEFILLDGIGASDGAKLLAANVLLSRCVGPMEFGARALGNRSILANPSDINNLKKINDAVKNRDFWMPFTPSIMEEYADEYLVRKKPVISPYMTIGYQSKELARRALPAALHPGDFSARPQFVTYDDNPEYWTLLEEFRKLTGVGALLNTSLNLHGEPMNGTVVQSVRTMALSALPAIMLPGDQLLVKKSAYDEIRDILRSG